MRSLIVAVFSLPLLVCTACAEEPVKYQCGSPTGVQVKIVGNLGDLVEVWDRGQRLYPAYTESRDQMGGASVLNCDRVKIKDDIVFIQMGHKRDLVQAYFLRRNARGDVDRVQQLLWNERDGVRNAESIIGRDILLRFGREQDLQTRLCANYKGDAVWWFFSGTPRTGNFPGCTAAFPNRGPFGQKAIDIPR